MTSALEFQPWPKIPRLFRDITVTEKIDGTNSAIIIAEASEVEWTEADTLVDNPIDGITYVIGAQSRNRLLTLEDDNFGFAKWVAEYSLALTQVLGKGRHFGEWWGQGIQRRYGMDRKVFSLFNTARYGGILSDPDVQAVLPQLRTVPVLYAGPFSEAVIVTALADLAEFGSVASEGFMNPEGVCVYHRAGNEVFKVTFDDAPKSSQIADFGDEVPDLVSVV